MSSNVAIDDLVALSPTSQMANQDNNPKPHKTLPNILVRILTAAVIAPVGVWVVAEGGVALVTATVICSVVAGFEWVFMAARLVARPLRFLLAIPLAIACVIAVLFAAPDLALVVLLGAATSVVLAGIGIVLKSNWLSLGFGAFYVTLPFGSFIYLRDFHEQSLYLMIAVMVTVWMTDTAGYLAGKGFGGPQLSPANSPNKTWTGAIAGVICALLIGVAAANLTNGPMLTWLIFTGSVSAVGQFGDLCESYFKRRFGVKDSSKIIPGHGGVLDRLDGLMAASALSGLIFFLAPGIAPLLLGSA